MAPQGQWAHCTVHLFPWFLLLIFGWLVLNMAAVLLHTLAGSSILASDPIQAAIRMGDGGGGHILESLAVISLGIEKQQTQCWVPSLGCHLPHWQPSHTSSLCSFSCGCASDLPAPHSNPGTALLWLLPRVRCDTVQQDMGWLTGFAFSCHLQLPCCCLPTHSFSTFPQEKKSLYLSLPDSSYLFSDCIWFVGIILNTAPLGTCNHPCLALCTYLFFLYMNSVPRHSQENFTGAEQQSQAQSISVLVRWGTASKALFEVRLFLPL